MSCCLEIVDESNNTIYSNTDMTLQRSSPKVKIQYLCQIRIPQIQTRRAQTRFVLCGFGSAVCRSADLDSDVHIPNTSIRSFVCVQMQGFSPLRGDLGKIDAKTIDLRVFMFTFVQLRFRARM